MVVPVEGDNAAVIDVRLIVNLIFVYTIHWKIVVILRS
jgi:hypothetical protein